MHPIRCSLGLAFLLCRSRWLPRRLRPLLGVGSVTVAWQWVDNTGHILSDGTFFPRGQSVTTSVLAEVDYGVTERFAATAACLRLREVHRRSSAVFGTRARCLPLLERSFQDLSIAGRYRFGDEFWALTPQVRLVIPTHDYPYRGEAVVGPNLRQLMLGITGSWRLVRCRRRASRPATPSRWSRKPLKTSRQPKQRVHERRLRAHPFAVRSRRRAVSEDHGGITAFDWPALRPTKGHKVIVFSRCGTGTDGRRVVFGRVRRSVLRGRAIRLGPRYPRRDRVYRRLDVVLRFFEANTLAWRHSRAVPSRRP